MSGSPAYDNNQNQGYYTQPRGRSVRRQPIHEWYVEGQPDWKPNDKFEFWPRAFSRGWDNRGDAGSRTGFTSGSWDETNLTDANAYPAPASS